GGLLKGGRDRGQLWGPAVAFDEDLRIKLPEAADQPRRVPVAAALRNRDKHPPTHAATIETPTGRRINRAEEATSAEAARTRRRRRRHASGGCERQPSGRAEFRQSVRSGHHPAADKLRRSSPRRSRCRE